MLVPLCAVARKQKESKMAQFAWMGNIRRSLAGLQPGDVDPPTQHFFYNHYQANVPTLLKLRPWPAFAWTVDTLRRRIGNPLVEVQGDRLADPQYELNAPSHQTVMPFHTFLDEMMSGAGNNVYMTAQNRSANSAVLAPLWKDIGSLPTFLRPRPEEGFVWLGRDTMTPLHHDETNNLMCQIMGWKLLRLFDPDQRDKLDHYVGVHSRLGWVTDDVVAQRGLIVRDVWLQPGSALFLPIGWWHCVKAIDTAMTLVYTNFIWQNFWNRVTD
jgi:Cupin-like domain